MKKLISKSVEETKRIGESMGKRLFPGAVVSLVGDLGSGKTCFVKGLARGLQIEEAHSVTSPSFVLVREYPGRIPLYHLDFYRLEVEQIQNLALEEYFYKDGVTVMEWGDKVEKLLPEAYFEINFTLLERDSLAGWNTRAIKFIPHGKIYQKLLEEF